MKLEIFDVEHGQCTVVTGDAGTHMLIDAGHNGSTGWRPSEHLGDLGVSHVDRLIVTNYDEDHVSDLHNVLETASVGILLRNNSVKSSNLLQLKSEHGAGRGIKALAPMLDKYIHPVTTYPDFGGLEIKSFWNSYPSDFVDENNLSVLAILKWPELCFAYTGDLELAGWKKLLERSDVRDALSEVNVFMASHHGRANGYCEEVFTATGMKPFLVVISDSGIDYETQKSGPWYRTHATGAYINGEERRVLTTRRDGTITFDFIKGAGANVTTSKRGPRLF